MLFTWYDDSVEEARVILIVVAVPIATRQGQLALLFLATLIEQTLILNIFVHGRDQNTPRLEIVLFEREEQLELHLGDTGQALSRHGLNWLPLNAVPVAVVFVAANEFSLI